MREVSSQSKLDQMQRAFAAHIRDPEVNAAPQDVEDRRMGIYRELFYRNVEGFISGGFPVLRSLIADQPWHVMIRDFFAHYRCQTPYFLEISAEFLHYLQTEREPQKQDLPFMLELAHYEWVEMVADTSDATIPKTGYHSQGDLLSGRPMISPLAYVLHYEFPVHRICQDYLPLETPAQATFLIVHRNAQDEVKFMEINGVTARLLTLIEENPTFTGRQAVQALAKEMQHPDPAVMQQCGQQILNQLRDAGIILGSAQP